MDMYSSMDMGSSMDMYTPMDMDSSMDMGGMSMQMYYEWSITVTVLFKNWATDGNALYYSLTLIALFLLAFGSECWSAVSAKYRSSSVPSKGESESKLKSILGTKEQNIHYLVSALFYTTKLILGYQLMLAVMTYNVGISIVIFLGAFVGNFTFARFVDKADGYKDIDDIACHL
eukprot:CAMPEP_0117030788 /NCGR_PEP_ID=MMETSP0472-20121206/22197_1 /TAXON_ID=693140 ORGANISM="Tiarina fusus, Strain LIS" /NCGR_SAMPLE_ID=MMETSP0472 /ASSEMBLY_ACC=CAM_ASM_000603 /LENGTH=173 /DNA_ID=CAMNT_0004738965 /DNA_START=114 /DNA_END=635 /DNA_ORIENTATION=+